MQVCRFVTLFPTLVHFQVLSKFIRTHPYNRAFVEVAESGCQGERGHVTQLPLSPECYIKGTAHVTVH